ncbi:MAG: glycosyltransferase family 4 protein [Planctomycetota bacterium]
MAAASAPPCILITYPYPIGHRAAGGSRTTRELAYHLRAAGTDVIVLSVSTNALSRRFPRAAVNPDYLGDEHDAAFEAHGIELIRVPQNPWLYLWDGKAVRTEVRRILRRRRVDLVLGHYHEAGYLPDLCRRHGVKFGFFATWQTYTPLGHEPRGWRPRLQKKIRDQTIVDAHRQADINYAISDFTRRELIDVVGVAPERITLCPLGVEPSFLEIPRIRPKAITNLLFFGRITWMKGFQDALEALGKLRRRGVDGWSLRFIGERPDGVVERVASEHGVLDRVTCDGPFADQQLRQELERAHVAILPSHAESFGHSIVEAQASGMPVVSYAAGSVPEVVEDGVTGWLAPLKDTDRLSELIQQAMRDPEATFQAGLAARDRVARLYSWDRTAATILEGLRNLQSVATSSSG